jgi:predicted dehydrogenase
MTNHTPGQKANTYTRRDFLRTSTVAAAGAMATQAVPGVAAYANGSDRLKIGLVGCGTRGTTDAANCVRGRPGVELHALGDLFEERRGRDRRMGMNDGYQWLKSQVGDKMNVPPERRFVGWDAYKKVLETDIDLVLFVTPPHFRPQMVRAGIEAGKHVFMEKPVAVDPVGVRSIIESADMAEKKGVALMGGTQWRHRGDYKGVMQRIHDGAIGKPLAGQAHYDVAHAWGNKRLSGMSDMEWQIRNWYYFTWLSGDHLVEQSIHKVDILNWALGGPPKTALAMGGRIARTGDFYGDIYDHFAVDYDYGDGVHGLNVCRQIEGASFRMGEHIVGSKGQAVSTGRYGLKLVGENAWEYPGDLQDPSVTEHQNLIDSIRDGSPINDGKRVAESTLTAIMGRMSAYTGQQISWNWIRNASELELGPDKYEFGPAPTPEIAIPGQTELI